MLGKLNLFGKYLGIAFQILDDVLDYDISSDNFGKNLEMILKKAKLLYQYYWLTINQIMKKKIFWKKL